MEGVTTVVRTDAAPATRGGLFWSWVRTVTAAEFAGFAVPASVGAITAERSPWVTVPALLAAGAVEGSLLGLGQAIVLRRVRPGLPAGRWVAATAVAAVLAYAIGLAPSTLAGAVGGWPVWVLVAAGTVLGVALLATIGTAQWFVLRHHVARAGRWVVATGVAWLVGLAVFLGFTMPLWQPGQPLALTVAIGLAGGLLMAATSSAVTGLALLRLLDNWWTGTTDGPRQLMDRDS
jgi:hypothetical protein